jgi:hypothetical protein
MLSKAGRWLELFVLGFIVVAWMQCWASESTGRSPLDELPAHVKQVTYFGERADWSHSHKGRLTADGKKILFLEKTFGDAYEIELATRIIRPMTHHYFHEGYTRGRFI